MASFSKRPGGWLARVRRQVNGKPFEWAAVFRTKAEAQAQAAVIEAGIAAGRVGTTPAVPFSKLIDRYVEEETPAKRAARAEEYRFRRMLGLGKSKDGQPRERDPLTDVLLPDLRPEHFAAWRDRRLKQVSVASVLREWNSLSAACTVAWKEWNWLTENPMSKVRRPAEPPARKTRWTNEEIERCLLACGYDRNETPKTAQARVGAALLFALETAMRAGEIVGLTWPHVDLEARVAHLPKTKNGSPRDVPLSAEAVRIIRQLDPLKDDTGVVFLLRSDNLDALFRKAKARAMLGDVRFHDARAEATTRLSKKFDLYRLARITGHRDLRMLHDTYYRETAADMAKDLD
jgi:integrase